MKMHRFLGNFDFKKGNLEISDKAVINQIKNVLRLNKGAQVILCNGKGKEAIAEIISISKSSIEF